MKKGRKILACLILMVLVLSQVPTNLLVRAEEGEETKYNLSFELERDASSLNEIYQKHDESENESEKTDEKASDEEADGEADANKDNETVVDLSQETEAEEKTEENSSEEAKPVDEAKSVDEAKPIDEAKPVDEGLAGDESNQADEDEAIVLPSGGGEGSQEEKAEEVKDLNITYTLHIKGESEKSIEKRITYSVEKADFLGDLKFEGIEALSNNLEVKYYSKEDGSSFDEKSENFDLYLETNSEKTVLELPRIGEKEDSLRVKESNFEEAIEIGEEKVNEAVGDPNATEVYLNGQAGDDANDGSAPEKAVESFKRAKELAGTDKNIIVIGTTVISGKIFLEGANQKVLRGEKFNDFLFRVAGGTEASLRNIIIDGNSDVNKNIGKSLIEVKSDATLNINEGAVLRNNEIKAIKNTTTKGGAVHANNATINMSSGIVEKNQATYGGGIYLNKSILNFTGGTVQDNKSVLLIDTSVNQKYSAGGGILAEEGSTINMSSEAKVLNNFAAEIGGGISVGSNEPGDTNILNMTGGTVDNNIAGSSGGGIFVQAKYFFGGASKSYISGGRITNNKMEGSGETNMLFGGGGIYVNGARPEYGSNGELYLKNAIIRNNTSEWHGAGYASCPISKTKFYVNDGVAIYGNKVNKDKHYEQINLEIKAYYHNNIGKSVYLLSYDNYGYHSGQAEYKLEKRMLGGAPYNWKELTDDGVETLLPDEKLEGTLARNTELALNSSDEANELTEALGKVIIEGNYSHTRGAGIGSNGTVIFGTDNETKEVKVTKEWKDDNNKDKKRPSSIKVTLMANVEGNSNKYEVETVELNEKNNWIYEFKDLPSKSGDAEITYTVKEEAVDGYSSKITGSEKAGYTITNTPEEPEKETKEIKVSKVWDTADKKAFAKEITVELYKNNEKTDKTLTLNEDNNWQGSFKNLDIKDENDKNITYTIKEVGETDGKITFDGKEFKVSYSGDEKDGYTITNSYNPPEEQKKEYRDICVEKAWDIRGMKPISHIEVELYRDGEATGNTLVLSETNGWSGSFKNLEKASDGGHIYKYSVKEIGEKFYTVEISGEYYEVIYRGNMDSGFTIINREEPKKPQRRDIRVRKAWDITNQIPVDEIQVELYKDGRATGNVITLSEANGWSGRFEDLLAYDAEGVKYEYSVREVGEASRMISISGSDFDVSYAGDMDHSFIITNKENIPQKKKTEVRVNKTWQTIGETEAVQAELYMDGAATGKIITLSEANGWSGAFTDLDLEDEKGNKHVYTVKEVGEAGGQYTIGERVFTVSYSGDMHSGISIINSEEPPEEEEREKEPPKPKHKDKPDEPEEKETPPEKHIIPKTGVEEGTLSIVLALVVLVGLFFVKRKLNEGKSK
ncbi:MAG: Cna B-type domain-containing protein [Eubacteriales bacterium]|uniref:Cna B-type domain-containing protein n=1 Tax=Fenollaria sp. TaxID=1965292 RepID=UPI002A75FFB0|nr:Cna B-type domain-containing protein [Fenollaria sp.]MDD7340011.1 Cna B-type domain-containing protein [Eubacteriales bacterium]MDY3105477.1 Cna B-type domain-containing protein [Fenollaria sp.]